MKPFQFFRLDLPTACGITVLAIPVSIKVFLPLIHSEIIYPAELCIGFLVVWLAFDIFFMKSKIFPRKDFVMHPLTLLVMVHLLFNVASALTSTIPNVSAKAVLVKTSYVFVFYFMMQPLVRSSVLHVTELFRLYAYSMSFVILYTFASYFFSDLNLNGVNFLSNPFYSDHTIYAAALAFLTPVILAPCIFPRELETGSAARKVYMFLSALILAGLYFAFSRGAWISIVSCLVLLLLLKAGLRFYGILALSLAALFFVLMNLHAVKELLKNNKANAYAQEVGVYEKMLSVTNITNDLSNAERLNRWSCAVRMFRDKPWFGYGPGTYQFQYMTYQRESEMTPISLTTPLDPGLTSYTWTPQFGLVAPSGAAVLQGGGGTSHSEYFLALSESGFFAALTFCGLLVVSLYCGLRIFVRAASKQHKILALALLLGLVTYFVHGLFNNFLDDCKLAFLFWFSLASLATLDQIAIRNPKPENG